MQNQTSPFFNPHVEFCFFIVSSRFLSRFGHELFVDIDHSRIEHPNVMHVETDVEPSCLLHRSIKHRCGTPWGQLCVLLTTSHVQFDELQSSEIVLFLFLVYRLITHLLNIFRIQPSEFVSSHVFLSSSSQAQVSHEEIRASNV